ncbi:MAG: PRC-barrel domain-containing protein [Desulforhopalus sp.]
MKKYTKIYSVLTIAVFTVMLAMSPVFATDTKAPATTASQMDATKMHKDKMSPMKGGYSILGTKFIGMEIENLQGEDLGEVKDIMLDSKGKVRYAAVSYGGFLGVGDKMFAVPMEAFQFKRESDMFFDDVKLILNVSKEQLEGDEGFDDDNWPDFEDETYRSDLDKRYNIDRSHMNN